MYSADFDYHRARSLADAHRLLAAHPGAKLLAGGHSLIPLMKLRLAMPPAVIDIGRIQELRGISRSGDTIRIGALTTHAELAASADLQKSAVALAEAAAQSAATSPMPIPRPICRLSLLRSTPASPRSARKGRARFQPRTSSPES